MNVVCRRIDVGSGGLVDLIRGKRVCSVCSGKCVCSGELLWTGRPQDKRSRLFARLGDLAGAVVKELKGRLLRSRLPTLSPTVSWGGHDG
jgi:hypothetical protein